MSLQITIAAAGAGTTLEIGPMGASYESAIPNGTAKSGAAPVTIAWPEWELSSHPGITEIGIGGGLVNVAFTLTAAEVASGGW